MKKIVLTLGAVPLLAACLPPEGTTPEDLAAFDAALASIGCELSTENHYLPMELQTGMPREMLIQVAQYKVQREEAVSIENGGVRSVVGGCAPQAVAAAPEA
ncbi:hypothetical protein [Pacificoceanicola onchidii]|uniref:hypothetical protein n=1 Tax=Pacificoceanicola onchidii TaxID=2562685 RepID=UPI0010A3800E|nr:hypothetical protein [Pacificoceanicola onchidii]